MQARFIGFGAIEIDGDPYDYDVVIDRGRVRKRRKKPSRAYRSWYGHTPLSVDEFIPWGGKRLIIGTGANGKLPIMNEVYEAARERGIEITAVPTDTACKLISARKKGKVRAVLHVSC
jgi:hypothetical protein